MAAVVAVSGVQSTEFGGGVLTAGGRSRVPGAGRSPGADGRRRACLWQRYASGAAALESPVSRSWEEGGALGSGGRGRQGETREGSGRAE